MLHKCDQRAAVEMAVVDENVFSSLLRTRSREMAFEKKMDADKRIDLSFAKWSFCGYARMRLLV